MLLKATAELGKVWHVSLQNACNQDGTVRQGGVVVFLSWQQNFYLCNSSDWIRQGRRIWERRKIHPVLYCKHVEEVQHLSLHTNPHLPWLDILVKIVTDNLETWESCRAMKWPIQVLVDILIQ